MMKKRAKQWLTVVLSMAMTVSLAACGNSKKEADADNVTNSAYGQIWSVPSTVKIKQTGADFANKGTMQLSFDAVRNEYESTQLVITASKEVDSFVLEATDLSNGSDVLSKDNITVYVQKFIPYADYSGNGYMADALIPMDAASSYDENSIAKGNNGALWVTAYIPKETPAGVYEGTFKLTLKSGEKTEKLDVPVSLQVRDYTLSDELTAKTLFSWRYDRVSVGELDGSIEMMETYYEFFKDYRISLQSMPLETLSGEEFVANIEKYYDEISTYSLLKTVGDISGNILTNEAAVREQVFAVAAASSVERNLFDKAMIYSIDEPDLEDPAKREYVWTLTTQLNTFLESCVDEIRADNSGKYDKFKKVKNWEASILGIPNIIPMGNSSIEWLLQNEKTEEGQDMLKLLNCICPVFDVFEERNVDKVQKLCQTYDIQLWWYGCVNPVFPAATYHIGDENLLSARTISWLQKKYDVVGNLYWDAAAYTDEKKETYNEYINVYEEPYRVTASEIPAGDGFLAYPGAKYGVYGPLPSTRLMSIRDGMEEYELLKSLEETLTSMKDSFGTEFSADTAMNAYYRALAYNGCYMNKDGENGLDFTMLRTDLLQMLTGLDEGLGFVMGAVNVDNADASFVYYVNEGSTVSINGVEQSAVNGNSYEYSMNLEEATEIEVAVENGDGKKVTYNRFVASPVYYLTDTAMQFEVEGVVTGNALIDATHVPSASIETSLFGDVKVADLATIYMDVYNPGTEAIQTTIRMYSGSTYTEFGEFILEPGANTITLNIAQQKFKQMDSVDRIAFEFANAKDGKALSYEFSVEQITGEK